MPATDVTFGISRYTGALIESVETTDKIEKKALKGSDGNTARVHTYDPTTAGSVKGKGATTVVPGIGSSGVDGVTAGVTVIDEVKKSESNEDFSGFEFNFTNYPNAESVA